MGALSRAPRGGSSRDGGRGRRARDPGLAGWAVLVALGGAVGTSVRAALESDYPAAAGGWPWATFAINVAGSFALGALLEALARGGADAGWRKAVRLGCGTGVLGGFTTYSTFVLEVDRLLGSGHALTAGGYAVVSLVLGVAAALAGIAASTALHARTGAGAGGRQ